MTIDERLELYRERYYFELGRKDQLKNGVTLPLGLVTLLFGSLDYFLTVSFKIVNPNVKAISGLFIIIMFGSLLRAAYLLWKSYYKYTYAYIPSCKDLENYWTELNNYYQQYPNLGDTSDIYKNYLLNEIKKDTDENIDLNAKRTDYQHHVNTFIMIALISAVLTLSLVHGQRIISWTETMFLQKTVTKEVINNARPTKQTSQSTSSPQATPNSLYNGRSEKDSKK